MLPRNIEKPTYTTAFRHKNERNIPCTDDVGEMMSCSSNKYTLCQLYQIYSIKLRWHMSSSCTRRVFLDGGNPVAHRCPSLAGRSLDPCKHNAGICPFEGLIDSNVEGQCGLSAKHGQQCSYMELGPQY